MNSRRFHQAGMKKCQAGSEEMQAEWCRKQHRGTMIFAMAKRNFRKDCEKFAMVAKISQS